MQDDGATLLNPDQEAAVRWIEMNWTPLATFAWRNVVASGRGLVILHGDWRDDVSAGYQTATVAELAGHPWPDELVEATQHYDPKTDIVFLIAHGGGGTLLHMTTTPGRQPPHRAGVENNAPLLPSA